MTEDHESMPQPPSGYRWKLESYSEGMFLTLERFPYLLSYVEGAYLMPEDCTPQGVRAAAEKTLKKAFGPKPQDPRLGGLRDFVRGKRSPFPMYDPSVTSNVNEGDRP